MLIVIREAKMKNKNNNSKQKEKNQNRNCPSAKEVNEKEMFSRKEDCPKDELENQENERF